MLFLILVGAIGLYGLAVLVSLFYFRLSDRDDERDDCEAKQSAGKAMERAGRPSHPRHRRQKGATVNEREEVQDLEVLDTFLTPLLRFEEFRVGVEKKRIKPDKEMHDELRQKAAIAFEGLDPEQRAVWIEVHQFLISLATEGIDSDLWSAAGEGHESPAGDVP